MSELTFEFPVLVQHIKSETDKNYRVRPLFMLEPEVWHQRFDRALSIFVRETRQYLRYWHTSRSMLDELLWFGFRPEVNYQQIELNFNVGQHLVSGKIAVATFEVNGHSIACLPDAENYLFVIKCTEKGKYNLAEQIEPALQRYCRKQRKEQGKDWNPNVLLARAGDFVTSVELNISVKQPEFPFVNHWSLFATSLLGGKQSFHGGEEMEKVASDMNLLYPDDLKRAYCCEQIVQRLHTQIYRKQNIPIAIIGPLGAGRTSLIHGAVAIYMKKNEGKQYSLLEKIWHLDPIRVISGMSIVGMWQKRFEVILDYAISRLEQQGHPKNSDKLFIDNAVALMRIGRSAQDNMTLANVLKPYLEKGQLQVILEATPEEWNVLQEIDRGFTDLFEVFRVPSADLALATEILLHQRMRLEREYNCQISNIALHRICSLQRSYLRQKALPGAIVDLLRQIVVKYKNRSIEEQDVMNEFAASCRMQTKILDSAVGFAPREVERAIAAKLIGQPEAVDCLIQSIHLLKAKLNDPDKPLSFMFIGPTGVGKTQAAKVLNSYLFSGEEDMVRFDMNEYIDPYSVFRLIGNLDLPEGQLTGRIRHRPFCVLLFDEIEKAHASVHDLLLQLLGEGRLTDALGRTVDFTNTIVIMTSNVGAREANKALGFGSKIEQAQSIYHKALAQSFRPEFLNRIDRIVSFGQLSLEDIKQIARLQIEEILQRDGFMRRTTILSVSQSALDMVASKGFAPDLGGRALKRSIEREITNLAADQLISVQGDVPVLFQISNRDGQLYPHIIALEFLPRDLQWQIPISPQPGQTNSALEQLVASAEEIIVQINKDIDRFNAIEQNTTADQIPSMLQTENYLLREMIAELKSEISEVLWCANLPSFDLIPRYRQLRSGRKHLWRVSMFYVDELMAAIEIREFLREALINSPKAFADSQAEYLNYFLQMDYYQYLTRHPLQEQECRLYLHIYSMIEAKGQIEVSYLTNAYRDILKHLGFSTQNIDLDHQAASFTVIRSHRACNILQAEAGIHLFYLPFLSPIPVYVAIGQIPDHQSEPECCKLLANLSESQQAPAVEQSEQFANITPSEYYIIRLYCLKYADSKDDGSIHDLRTNLINKPNLSNQDWLLLLSAGWRQQTQTL